MMTETKALQLLKHYLNNEKTVKHCIGVAEIAYEIAVKMKQKNPLLDINPNKVKIGALLHDVGRFKEGIHELNTVDALKQEKLDDLAEIAMHGFVYELFLLKGDDNKNFLPQTLENKIVVLADMYYNQNEQRVSLVERFDDIEERYKNDEEFLKVVRLARGRINELENEINALI